MKNMIDVVLAASLGSYGIPIVDDFDRGYRSQKAWPKPKAVNHYDSGKPLTKRQKRRAKGKK